MAHAPFPRAVGDGKFMVWGQTRAGRYLQVIFVFKSPEDIEHDSLSGEQWMQIQDQGIKRVVRIIHAMDLSDEKKRQYRKQSR